MMGRRGNHSEVNMYWIYRKNVFYKRGKAVQARLLSLGTPVPEPVDGVPVFSPMQSAPYGLALRPVYRAPARLELPDYLLDSYGFTLFSERLLRLVQSFGTRGEEFPVRLVDAHGAALAQKPYFIFHSLEGILPAMDEERSGWTGDFDEGVPRLVLDPSRFEHRPLFVCARLYIPLMRGDLKQAIQREGMSGFQFLHPEHYHCGRYGMVREFDE